MPRSPASRARTRRLTRTQVLVLIGVVAVAVNLRSSVTSVGPLVPTIRAATDQTNVGLGVVGTLPVLAFGLVSPLAPILGRRFGLGRSLAGSMLLLTAALVIRSSGGFPALLVGTALMGAAIAIGNVLVPALVKRAFPTRAGALTSVYGAVMVLAAGVATAIAVPVAEATSWQTSLGVWIAPAAVATVAVFWSARADRTPTDRAPVAAAPRVAPKLLRDPVALQVTAFMGLQSTLFYVVFNWWADIVGTKGVSEAQAGAQLTVMSVAGLIGITVFPALTERVRRQEWLGAMVAVLMCVAALLLLVPAAALTTPASIVFGLGSGGSLGLALTFIGLRSRTEEDAAALSGMAQTWGYLISAIGPVAIGAVSVATGGWTVPTLVVIALTGGGAVFGWLAGRDRVVGGRASPI